MSSAFLYNLHACMLNCFKLLNFTRKIVLILSMPTPVHCLCTGVGCAKQPGAHQHTTSMFLEGVAILEGTLVKPVEHIGWYWHSRGGCMVAGLLLWGYQSTCLVCRAGYFSRFMFVYIYLKNTWPS